MVPSFHTNPTFCSSWHQGLGSQVEENLVYNRVEDYVFDSQDVNVWILMKINKTLLKK